MVISSRYVKQFVFNFFGIWLRKHKFHLKRENKIMRRLKTPLNPSLIIAVFYSEHALDDFLPGLIVRAMIKCSRSLPR